MKYLIYLLIAALVLWSVWYLVKTVRRQIRGGCGCICGGNCGRCGQK